MQLISGTLSDVFRAVRRGRLSMVSVALMYVVSISLGILLTHTGNGYALSARDQLVNQAMQQDPAAIANNQGNSLQAALLDFAGNLSLGALPKTLAGLGIVTAYPLVAYQGWVGGIVSVRDDHSSRLDNLPSGAYYLLTLLLQTIPYSLAVGAGVNAGISMFRPQPDYQGKKFLGLVPREALLDIGRIYLLAAPLFLIASLWEFFSPWNR